MACPSKAHCPDGKTLYVEHPRLVLDVCPLVAGSETRKAHPRVRSQSKLRKWATTSGIGTIPATVAPWHNLSCSRLLGAVALARSVRDEKLSNEILESIRQKIG